MTDEQVAQFTSLTDAGAEVAQTYLRAANGDVGEAVESYFQAQEAASGTSAQPSDDYTGPRTLSGARASPLPSSWGGEGSSRGSASNSGTSTPSGRKGLPSNTGPTIQSFSGLRNAGASGGGSNARPSGRGNVMSFAEMQRAGAGAGAAGGGGRPRPSNDDDDDDEDAPDDPLNFFAGGERSALAVQNPDHGRRRAGDAPGAVSDILRQAEEEGHRAEPTAPGSTSWFGGRGRTVADEGEDEEKEDNEDEEMEEDEEPPTVVRTITFWADGFSIGPGPLLSYEDPRHQQILEAIKARRAPLELLDVAFGQQVELRIERRLRDKYEAPPPGSTPFAGAGNRLGSPGPTVAVTAPVPAATPAAAVSNPLRPSVTAFEVDASQPTTQVQLRLADGSRTVGRFNHTHTIADVRRYIDSMAPNANAQAYTLQASFPPKPLADESLTLNEAGLLNSSIIQKFT